MKICVYGAGAIGGLLGGCLHRAGQDVSLVARGPHLAAIKSNGLTVRMDGQEFLARPQATDDPSELGPQDYVIVTLKAHSVPHILESIQPLLREDTAIVWCVNGVPWWYFYGIEGPYAERRLATVDPGDRQWEALGPQRMIGCVVYPAAEIVEPGVVRHLEGKRFTLGEPSDKKTDRAKALAGAFIESGFRAPIRRIREELWLKLWGNVSFNPISALTLGTLDLIATDPGTRSVARSMMEEAKAIGESLGIRFSIDVERRLDGGAAVGPHRTSMLQDLEQGRPMEIDALLSAVQEMARLTAVPTPTIDAVLALVRQRAFVAGLYSY